MLDRMSWRSRSLLSLSLTSLALVLSVLAFCTSYWCEGTHKVVKPPCLSPVKMKNCSSNDSQVLTDESPTPDPRLSPSLAFNRTVFPNRRQLANVVHYIWETGEDKYTFRYFHTGFWESCEKHPDGERCRSFIELTPGESQGVLWLSVVSEVMHIGLLATSYILMWLEVLCMCLHMEMHALRVNAFAAVCTVMSGLMGMVAQMMYTTVFQLTLAGGPKDWRPQTWDYGWSFALAWVSFSCCMAAAVFTLNSYTKTVLEQGNRLRLCLEDSHCSWVPPYDEVLHGEGFCSAGDLLQCPDGVIIHPAWTGDTTTLVLVGEYGMGGCEDCEREIEEMEATIQREGEDSLC